MFGLRLICCLHNRLVVEDALWKILIKTSVFILSHLKRAHRQLPLDSNLNSVNTLKSGSITLIAQESCFVLHYDKTKVKIQFLEVVDHYWIPTYPETEALHE